MPKQDAERGETLTNIQEKNGITEEAWEGPREVQRSTALLQPQLPGQHHCQPSSFWLPFGPTALLMINCS